MSPMSPAHPSPDAARSCGETPPLSPECLRRVFDVSGGGRSRSTVLPLSRGVTESAEGSPPPGRPHHSAHRPTYVTWVVGAQSFAINHRPPGEAVQLFLTLIRCAFRTVICPKQAGKARHWYTRRRSVYPPRRGTPGGHAIPISTNP